MQVAKGLKEWMKIKKKFKMVMCLGVLDIVSIPNGHIPLCGGHFQILDLGYYKCHIIDFWYFKVLDF